jgi:hypothetical protein
MLLRRLESRWLYSKPYPPSAHVGTRTHLPREARQMTHASAICPYPRQLTTYSAIADAITWLLDLSSVPIVFRALRGRSGLPTATIIRPCTYVVTRSRTPLSIYICKKTWYSICHRYTCPTGILARKANVYVHI